MTLLGLLPGDGLILLARGWNAAPIPGSPSLRHVPQWIKDSLCRKQKTADAQSARRLLGFSKSAISVHQCDQRKLQLEFDPLHRLRVIELALPAKAVHATLIFIPVVFFRRHF